jgi:dCMP deaminase
MSQLRLTHEQYMEVAGMAKAHADCKRSKVGAVLVLPSGITLVGVNGSPTGHTKCLDGGCYRCEHPDAFPPGTGYDRCSCVHAEGRCLMAALNSKTGAVGGIIYSTLRPCLECSKHMLEAGIVAAYFQEDRLPDDPAQRAAYLALQSVFPGGMNYMPRTTFLPGMATMAEVRVEVPFN